MNELTTLRENLSKELGKANNVYITGHLGPDGDAISSALGVYNWVVKNFPEKTTKVLFEGKKTDIWDYFPLSAQINWVNSIADLVHENDLLILVDGAEPHRFSDSLDFSNKNYTTFCIAHHPMYQEVFDYLYIDTASSSASQIVTDYLYEDSDIDLESATILLFGIFSDTASLIFVGTRNSTVLNTVKRLIDIAKIPQIDSLLIKSQQVALEDITLLGDLLKNTITVDIDDIPPFTYTYLEKDVLDSHSSAHVKNARSLYYNVAMRKVQDHNWGFIVVPKDDGTFGISFRADNGQPNVQNIAREFFDGGGHIMASGGVYRPAENEEISTQEVCLKVVEAIKKSKIELISL